MEFTQMRGAEILKAVGDDEGDGIVAVEFIGNFAECAALEHDSTFQPCSSRGRKDTIDDLRLLVCRNTQLALPLRASDGRCAAESVVLRTRASAK
jgi:hypothetical protein